MIEQLSLTFFASFHCTYAFICLNHAKKLVEFSIWRCSTLTRTYKQLYHAGQLKAPECLSAQIISTHVISLKCGPGIIPLCGPPPSCDPNPQVWVHVCMCMCHMALFSQRVLVSWSVCESRAEVGRNTINFRSDLKIKKKKWTNRKKENAIKTFITLLLLAHTPPQDCAILEGKWSIHLFSQSERKRGN